MNRASLLMFSLLLSPTSAIAGDLSVGFGLDAAVDLADGEGRAAFSKFAGAGLMIPVRVRLSDYAQFRATVRTMIAPGQDRVSWSVGVPSDDPNEPAYDYFASTTHWAMIGAAGATFGLEASTKDVGLAPYFGAEVGPMLMNAYHSFGAASDTSILLKDLTEEQQDDTGFVEPYTSQLVFLTDLHVGARAPLSESLNLWFELGYAAAYLPAAPLKGTPPELNAQRDGLGWNALRLGVGLSFSM